MKDLRREQNVEVHCQTVLGTDKVGVVSLTFPDGVVEEENVEFIGRYDILWNIMR